MILNLISWNIEHLRMEKVEMYLDDIIEQVAVGHVLFLYENKLGNTRMARPFVDMLGGGLSARDQKATTVSKRTKWNGHLYDVGTNEGVWIVYSSEFVSSVGNFCYLRLKAKHDFDADLRRVGGQAHASCQSNTVLSNRSVGKTDFRIPAVVNLWIDKQDGSRSGILRVAAWHAPGPSEGSAHLLNEAFQKYLEPYIDLFLGDFNLTGLDNLGGSIKLQPTLKLHRTNQSTTISAAGPVGHAEGYDLVYRHKKTLGGAASNKALGRAEVSVIPIPASMNYQEASKISDHRPILVTVRGLFH
jgi:hypothetical protein